MLVCWGLAARWFVEGTRVGGATEYAPPGATIGGEYTSPGMIIHPLRDVWWAYAIRPYTGYVHRGTCIRYVRRYVHSAPFGGVRGAYAVAPRGFAAQGFALGYGPAGLQPGRVRPIRARGPVWWGVCNTPLPWYVHSGPFRVPGQIRRPPQGPTLLADGCRDRRRRRRAFRVSYRPRPASWDPSASRHRASSVPWAAWDLWDPSAA